MTPTPGGANREAQLPGYEKEHEHGFLNVPGRCIFCGITTEELRRQEEHRMLVAAFDRLAAVLEKMEAKL